MGRLYPLAWLAPLLEDPPKTESEWIDRAAAGPWPPHVDRLAAYEFDGDISQIHRAWSGWRLNPRTGKIEAPNGWAFRPDEVMAISIRMGQIRELHHVIARIGSALESGLTIQAFEALVALTKPYLENDHHRIERGIGGKATELLAGGSRGALPSLGRYDAATPHDLQPNRCKGATKGGEPCRSWAKGVTGFCVRHQEAQSTAALPAPPNARPSIEDAEAGPAPPSSYGIGAGDTDPLVIGDDGDVGRAGSGDEASSEVG